MTDHATRARSLIDSEVLALAEYRLILTEMHPAVE